MNSSELCKILRKTCKVMLKQKYDGVSKTSREPLKALFFLLIVRLTVNIFV